MVIPDTTTQIDPMDIDTIGATIGSGVPVVKVMGGSGLMSTERMFNNCYPDTIDLSDLDTSNVVNMEGMFEDCHAQTIDLRNFKTDKVTNMRDMFNNCMAQVIDITSFNTENVTDMRRMFRNCHAKELNLLGFNTSKVINMQKMFSECKAKSLDLRSFDTSNVINMDSMFKTCRAQMIDLSSFDMSNTNNIEHIFDWCKAKEIILNELDANKINKITGITRCEAVVKIKNKLDIKVDNHFIKKARLIGLDIKTINPENPDSTYYKFELRHTTIIYIPDTTKYTGKVECSGATRVVGGSGLTSTSGMFCMCKANYLNLSGLDTSNVTNMMSMFSCSTVGTIDLSGKLNTDKVEGMGYMFKWSAVEVKTTDPKILKELKNDRG